MVFNERAWTPERLMQHIWTGMIDYDRGEWAAVNRRNPRVAQIQDKCINTFVKCQCRKAVFAQMVDGKPKWVSTGPWAGFIFQPP